MKIKVVENPPIDPREFDLPEGFSEENIEDVVEICLLYTSDAADE